MCKFDQVIYVDNADRGANSTSDSDFEIELDHAFLLDDTNGVAIKSLTVANPLQTVNANVNDKLYLRLGVLDRVVSLAANDYDTSTLPTQIGTAINALFTALPSINFTATSEWYRFENHSVGVLTVVQGVFKYQFGDIATDGGFVEFTAFDVNDGTATLSETIYSNGNPLGKLLLHTTQAPTLLLTLDKALRGTPLASFTGWARMAHQQLICLVCLIQIVK